MEFSIVENLSGLQESIFNLSRGPQLHLGEKSKNWSNFIKFIDFPPFPLFGVPWAAVIHRLYDCCSCLLAPLVQVLILPGPTWPGPIWAWTHLAWPGHYGAEQDLDARSAGM